MLECVGRLVGIIIGFGLMFMEGVRVGNDGLFVSGLIRSLGS